MKTFSKKLFSALIACLIVFSSCSEDNGESNPTAPQLPPQQSMSANMGGFPSNGEGSAANSGEARTHFNFAAGNVLFWQTLINVQLAIPVAAFQEAFNHSFEYLDSDGIWKSEYDVSVANKSMTATLYADRSGNQIEWEMYLSLPGEFDNFLWFSGESNLDNSGGTWVLYRSPSEPRAALQIDWQKENDATIKSTYTLIDTQADKSGSFIEFGLSSEAAFTHYYEVSVKSESSEDYDALIYYNQETRIGSVTSVSYFGDNDKRCWNSSLENTDCQN